MKFRKKASALVLCAVLLGTSVVPVSAANKDEIVGANRYDTAAKIADRMGNYDTAILVNSDKSLADGLSASSLAGKENAPILLVKQNSIPSETLARLQKVKKVYIIGGTAAISKNVENQLYGKAIQRIEGKNRIDTSEKVAALVGNYNEAFIVNGNKGEADAMSVAAVAARDKAPILLTNGNSTNQQKRSGVSYYVVGGEAVVSSSLVNKFGAVRLSGSNRYRTNKVVVERFYSSSDKLYFTKGDKLVDALTVSSLAKGNGVAFVSRTSDKSILKGKATLAQVGGMDKSIVDSIFEEDLSSLAVGNHYLEINKGDKITINSLNVKATDIDGTDISHKVKIEGTNGPINTNILGRKDITVSVELSNGKILKEYVVIDISIKKDLSSFTIKTDIIDMIIGEEVPIYKFGVKATDVDGSDISHKVKIRGSNEPIDVNRPCGMDVTLYVELSNGKVLEQCGFLVISKPDYSSLKAESSFADIYWGTGIDPIRDFGVKATDIDGTDISHKVKIKGLLGELDLNKFGMQDALLYVELSNGDILTERVIVDIFY